MTDALRAELRICIAARDLLEAAQEILKEHDDEYGNAMLEKRLADRLRAAVKKATGEE